MTQKFLEKYFLSPKIAKLSIDISFFSHLNNETLNDNWEHFKDLFKRCLHHVFPT